MAQSLSQIYLHIIFSTKHREPTIDVDIETELHSYISGICSQLDCHPVKVGGYVDHIHIACSLSKKITLVKLLEEVKKSSSRWIKTKGSKYNDFYWQDGYAAFSVNPSQLDALVDYISTQHERHQKISFQDECRVFFKKYGFLYDERYVWD